MKNLDWFKYEDSRTLEQEVKYNIASNAEMGLNCYYDKATTEPRTINEWIEYIYVGMQQGFITGNTTYMGVAAANHLHFYGKDKTIALIRQYVTNYESMKPYISEPEYNNYRGVRVFRDGQVMYAHGGIESEKATEDGINLVEFVQAQFQFSYVKECKWEYEISRTNCHTHETEVLEKVEHMIDEATHIKKSYKWVTGREME